MNTENRNKLVFNPKFRVITTWIFLFLGTALVILILIAICGFNIELAFQELQIKRYLTVYIEIVSVGLLPLLYAIICKEKPSIYGINAEKEGILKSILLASCLMVFLFTLGYLTTGKIVDYESYDFQLSFPWNMFYFVLGVFTWGPLEVFFFVFLIVNTDKIFNSKNRIISHGLLITVIIFAIAHIITTSSIYNAFYTGSIFLILGLIYKYTDNSIGLMIAWTLINSQIWFIAQMLWI